MVSRPTTSSREFWRKAESQPVAVLVVQPFANCNALFSGKLITEDFAKGRLGYDQPLEGFPLMRKRRKNTLTKAIARLLNLETKYQIFWGDQHQRMANTIPDDGTL